MRHVVMFSGGLGSWATAKRIAERHGTSDPHPPTSLGHLRTEAA